MRISDWSSDVSDSTLLVMAANLGGFGVLWVSKFLFLDQIMFGHSEREEVLAQDPSVAVDPACAAPADRSRWRGAVASPSMPPLLNLDPTPPPPPPRPVPKPPTPTPHP